MHEQHRPRVIIESPFAGNKKRSKRLHVDYARRCMKDSLSRGECPFASHLLYTQSGILDDKIKDERQLGMQSGYTWMKSAGIIAVYTDFGISSGMRSAILHAHSLGKRVVYRSLSCKPTHIGEELSHETDS